MLRNVCKVLVSTVTSLLALAVPASAGDFTIDWNTLAYPAGTLAPAAPNFVLTDQYGFQVRMALVHPTTNYTAITTPSEDTAQTGNINDIMFANDAPQGSGAFGEDTRTATLNFYQVGTTTNVPVNGLTMLVTDIDPLDNNTPVSDRCDMVTVTGNAGNPTLGYVTAAPSGAAANVSFIIGPSTGPGTSGTNANSRTIFTKTGGGTARTNLNLASNQAHCLYYTNASSTSSANDTNGSMTAAFPNGTSSVTVRFDEVIENVLGATTPANQNPQGRYIGVWGGGSFSIPSSITLDKQTTATDFTAAGNVINYSFVVTNAGPIPLNSGQNIQINDSKIGLINCPAIPVAGIAVGGTLTCTASYTVTAADVTAGFVTNTATAGVGTGAQTFATRLQSNSDIVTVPRATTLTLVKTVSDTSGSPSTVPLFTLTATNTSTSAAISGITGAAAVTNALVGPGSFTLSENNVAGYTAGNWSCVGGSLAGSVVTLTAGQNATCTINNVKRPTLVVRKISNGGTGSFGFSGSNGVATEAILTTSAGGTFTGGTSILTQAGVSTTITETMPEAFWEIQAATCTGMGTGGTASLAGNVLTLDAAAAAAGRNIVCTFTNRRRPTVSVQKITTGAFGGAFSFADTNLNGTVANISTTAVNTATPAAATRLIATAVGTQVTLAETSPLSFVSAGVTCTDANSAVSGNTNPVATSLTSAITIPNVAVRIGADINCVFTNAQAVPVLAVNKTASVPTVNAAGSVVNYVIAVSNNGNTPLTNIAVTDALGTVTCPSTSAATIAALAPGTSENCSFNYTVPQSVLNSNGGGDGDIDNSATASATYNSAPVSANGAATVGLVISPSLSIQKIPSTTSPVNAGATIGYIYRVTNTGNVTMNNVTISDAHVGFGTMPVPNNESLTTDALPTGDSSDAAVNGTWNVLAPGDMIEFTSSYTVVQADIDNLQ